jgi:hypothetical protein
MKKLQILVSMAVVVVLLMGAHSDCEAKVRDFSGSWISPYPQANTLNAVWGASGSDVFAVGEVGTIIHYDGSVWTSMDSGTTENLEAVWGSSGSDVFAVGWDGIILHYDGSSWTEMESQTTAMLRDVWGASSSDIFAVGKEGTILHYDGSSWTEMPIATSADVGCIWGASGNDVYAVTRGVSAVFHYDGTSWSETVASLDLFTQGVSIWGRSGSDIYIAGTGQFAALTMYHYDGTSWSGVFPGTGVGLYDVWVSSGQDVMCGFLPARMCLPLASMGS